MNKEHMADRIEIKQE